MKWYISSLKNVKNQLHKLTCHTEIARYWDVPKNTRSRFSIPENTRLMIFFSKYTRYLTRTRNFYQYPNLIGPEVENTSPLGLHSAHLVPIMSFASLPAVCLWLANAHPVKNVGKLPPRTAIRCKSSTWVHASLSAPFSKLCSAMSSLSCLAELYTISLCYLDWEI